MGGGGEERSFYLKTVSTLKIWIVSRLFFTKKQEIKRFNSYSFLNTLKRKKQQEKSKDNPVLSI